jgi:hypothetical protein
VKELVVETDMQPVLTIAALVLISLILVVLLVIQEPMAVGG